MQGWVAGPGNEVLGQSGASVSTAVSLDERTRGCHCGQGCDVKLPVSARELSGSLGLEGFFLPLTRMYQLESGNLGFKGPWALGKAELSYLVLSGDPEAALDSAGWAACAEVSSWASRFPP